MDASPHAVTRLPTSRSYWLCQLGGWGLYSTLQLCAGGLILHLPWARIGVELLVLNGTGLVFTHRLHAYIRAHNWSSYNLRSLVPRIAVASLLLALPLGLVSPFTLISSLQSSESLIHEVAPRIQLHFGPLIRFVHQWANWATLFALWLVIYFVALSIRRRRDAELRQSELTRALQLAELRLLKSQLNPHFLFNSLNSVRALIADDPAGAQKAVTQLARTLRYTLTAGRQELVPLARELEIVEDYLALESLRFGERLRIERDLAPEAMAVRVPVMLLQTVVENAIKHGIAELPAGGDLRIVAGLEGGTLHIDVENTRPQKTEKVFRSEGEGVGLDNAAERLRLLFGAKANLDLNLSRVEVAVARIRIPETA
jgi:hypothetical protein